MRKYAKLYALLGVGLLMGACQDDYGFEPIVINPGDDIQFGANANFEAGDEETRTIYGDVVTDENGSFIEVKWLEGIDKVDIACEQAIGTMIAEYTVGNVSLDTTSHASSAQQLTKTGDVGLQWSNSTDYVFHAMYPSKECLKAKLIEKGMTSADVASLGLDYTKTAHNSDIVRGYLPMNQSPLEVVPTENGYVATPDMNFAYMLAQKKYSTSSNKNVGLSFQSLVTALQFDITAGSLGASAATNGITINKLVLQTATGLSNNICGYFNYTFPDIASTDLSQGTFAIPEDAADYKQITMEFATPVNFTEEGQYLDATFFLLPKTGDAVYESDDLKLTIFYTLKDNNGIEIPQSKTAVIGRELASRKKYYFADMNMPAIGNVFSSNWFSAVPEPVYISQLSMPAASNTFSYYYSADNADAKYIREQVHPYTDLWNMGVRGFEFVTSTNGTDTINSIGSEGFVCAGSEIEFNFEDGSKLTFDKAFTDLTKYLNNEAYPQFANECLVIICRYQSYTGDDGGGINPQLYLTQLINYLKTQTHVDFVKVTPESCAGDLRGKVAVIVRPGDNCYGNTDGLTIPNDWKDKITVIGDWGSSVDVWDRRFGDTYQREGVVNVTNNTATNIVEQSLWAAKEATTSSDYLVSYKGGYPTTDKFNFYHTVNGTANAAFVQDFLRVIPTKLGNKEIETVIRGKTPTIGLTKGYLFVKWPASIQQKKDMVEVTLDSVMATRGKDASRIYINNLSGYYATENHVSSIYPYAGSRLYTFNRNYVDYYFNIPTSGAGGDYPGLAADINTFFYDKIKDLNENTSGPFGLVMMNYIGATATEFQTSEYVTDGTDAAAASSALPTKILMNNFSFPLMMNEDYYNGLQ